MFGRERKHFTPASGHSAAASWAGSRTSVPKNSFLASVEHAATTYAVVVLVPFGYIAGVDYMTPVVASAMSWTTFNIFPWNFVIFSFFFILGSTWIFWALSYTTSKKRSEKLNMEGPYSLTRNPKGFGYLTILLGLGVFLQSAVAIFVMMPAIAVVYFFYLKFLEEPLMRLKHGRLYEEYRSNVPLLFPLPSRLRK